MNNRRRWIAPWKDSRTKPVIYHCISRVVGRGFLLEDTEREHFRMLMRMCEKFTGCRVLSYCLMSNHFHLLLEVPPMPEGGVSDAEFFERLGAFYNEAHVAEIRKEMADVTKVRVRGEFELPPVDEAGQPFDSAEKAELAQQQAARTVEEIRHRYTRRMHDLSEFMKSLLERFTKWFNRRHSRSGHLWEDRFRSVIVESGTAARIIAAYIDLNPVRAGIVEDPAEYRWSSYGEAVGGGPKGNGKKAREGLVRAYGCDQGVEFDVEKWSEVSRLYRRLMGMALQRKGGAGANRMIVEYLQGTEEEGGLKSALHFGDMLRHRVRYFADGAVIGGKAFVNEAFAAARERFSPRRKDGARRMRGNGKPAAGVLWSLRDLRVGIGS